MDKKDKKRARELIMEITGQFWGICFELEKVGVPKEKTDKTVLTYNKRMIELKDLIENAKNPKNII
mgnify:CR=1 FL=1